MEITTVQGKQAYVYEQDDEEEEENEDSQNNGTGIVPPLTPSVTAVLC